MTSFPEIVLIDQREKLPYTFEGLQADRAAGGGLLSVTTAETLLETGDYTLSGYADRIAVERKSLDDLYGTLGQGRRRFERELERLAALRVAAVVIEASLQDVLQHPPVLSQMSPKAVYRSILAWTIRYPTVHWLPCGCRRLAEVTTFRLLEKFWQANQRKDAIA